MRSELLALAALGAAVATAGCAGAVVDGGDPGASKTAAPGPSGSPLRGVEIWIAGTLVDANASAVVLETDGKRIALNATHGAFFETDGGPQEWTSTGGWTGKGAGASVCVSAHVHRNGGLHVVKAFYDSACAPLAKR